MHVTVECLMCGAKNALCDCSTRSARERCADLLHDFHKDHTEGETHVRILSGDLDKLENEMRNGGKMSTEITPTKAMYDAAFHPFEVKKQLDELKVIAENMHNAYAISECDCGKTYCYCDKVHDKYREWVSKNK